MPKAVPIGIFNVARTQVDREAVERWLKFIDVEDFNIPDDGGISDPALLIALAAKRCYKSFEVGLNPNVTRIRKDYGEYLDNVLKSGHGSTLEHSVYTFALENVSRVFTGEMNRHRAGWAISEGSMRFIRFGECIPYWLPTSIAGPDVLPGDYANQDYFNDDQWVNLHSYVRRGNVDLSTIEAKQHFTRMIFNKIFGDQEGAYRLMELVWADELKPEAQFKDKKNITSMMRRIVGMGCATGGVWSGNIRALRHVLTMRCSPAAEEEILHVFSRVAKMMQETEPMLFGDFYQTEDGFWVPKYVKV